MSGLERWGLASWITHPWRPLPKKLIPFCAALGVWFSIYAMYGTVYMLLYGTVYMLLYGTVYMLCMVQYICYCMVQCICYVWYSIYAIVWYSIHVMYGTVYMLCMVQYICYCMVQYICSFLSFHTKKKLAIENGLNTNQANIFYKKNISGLFTLKIFQKFWVRGSLCKKISLSQNLSEISQVKWFNNQIILMNTHINILKICGKLSRKSFYRFLSGIWLYQFLIIAYLFTLIA